MPLTYFERKARLPHGAVSIVAVEQGRGADKISLVLSGKMRNRAIETRLASLMRDPDTGKHVTVSEAFGPPSRSLRRSRTSAAS